MLRSTTMAPTRSVLPRSIPLSMFCLPQSIPLPIPPRSALPVPSRGIPMDIDAVQKMRSLPPRGYYWCGEASHLVKDCLHCLDVRKLTMEQREELIKDLMALKNAVEEVEVGSAPEEDFV